MAASYPTSAKTFTTKATNDVIAASHVNDLQDEVTAVESALLTALQHNLLFTDNTYDIGASGATRPRDLFLSRNLNVAGGQIVFPGTQVPSTNVNTLDDYEEGSWTPVIGGSGGTSGQTYTSQVGRYIKIGKTVIASFNAVLSAKGTITDNVQIQGLPFTSENTTGVGAWGTVAYVSLATNWVNVIFNLGPNVTAANIQGATAAALTNTTALVTADIGNTTQLAGVIIFRATD